MQFDRAVLIERITPRFHDNFVTRGELGAAVSVWHQGEPVIDLFGGFRNAHRTIPWTSDTMVLFWSATKGIGAVCLLHALEQEGIELARRVADIWPEFAQAGKGEVTLAQLLSHQAGLSAIDQQVELTDYAAVVAALETQTPLWPPGSAHGYHARTFGFLLDELVRRLTGITIGTYWRSIFAEPIGLDIWIGLPHEQNNRVATIYAAKAGKAPEPAEFYQNLTTPGTIQRRTFTSPRGLHAVSAFNLEAVRAQSIVSLGGIGSAASLARFYAMLANGGELGGRRYFKPETMSCMTTTLASGIDRVFGIPTAFSAGFMQNATSARPHIFGRSKTAFGHPGAGGSHAFADPESNLSFAYVMNQMEQSLLPNEKSLQLVEALSESTRDS